MKEYNLKVKVLDTEFTWQVFLATSMPLVVAAAQQGFQRWLTDAASQARPNEEEMKEPAYSADNNSDEYKTFMKPIRMRELRRRYGEIKAGTYKPSRGGPRQNPATKAWIAYLAALNHLEAGKPVTGRTLGRAQASLCRRHLLSLHDAGSPERALLEANIRSEVESNLPEFILSEQTNNKVLSLGIEYQKMLATIAQ